MGWREFGTVFQGKKYHWWSNKDEIEVIWLISLFRLGCVVVLWRLPPALMWATFSASDPHTSGGLGSMYSGETQSVWLKSGWTTTKSTTTRGSEMIWWVQAYIWKFCTFSPFHSHFSSMCSRETMVMCQAEPASAVISNASPSSGIWTTFTQSCSFLEKQLLQAR